LDDCPELIVNAAGKFLEYSVDELQSVRERVESVAKGVESLPEGVESVAEGVESLPNGVESVAKGVESLPEGVDFVAEGVESLHAMTHVAVSAHTVGAVCR
jgi:methyl-accepting chemotaxis protein